MNLTPYKWGGVSTHLISPTQHTFGTQLWRLSGDTLVQKQETRSF